MAISISRYACKKWCTVLGSFVILSSLGGTWYWGNLSVYVMSYALTHLPSSSVDTPWVPFLMVMSSSFGMFLSAVMVKYIGKRLTLTTGFIVFASGWVSAYVAIGKSLFILNIIIGVVVPSSRFIIQGTALLYAVEWCHLEVGFVSSLTLAGIPAGAIFINQLITRYINPTNLTPDKQVGPSKYFTQDEVLDNVPSLFLVIACVALAFNILGQLLIREFSNSEIENESYIKIPDLKEEESPDEESESTVKSDFGHTNQDLSSANASNETTELSLMKLVRSPALYGYWLLVVVAEIPLIVIINYYKTYGQLYIDDDHFLTNLTTPLLVFIAISRTCWGWMLDKYKLVTCLLIYFTSCSIASVFFYFSPLIHIWCYVIAVFLFGCVASPLFIFLSYGIANYFGKTHYLFSAALVMLPTVPVNLTLPLVINYILVNWGWFYVYAFSSCCSLLGVVATILFWIKSKK